MGTETGSGIVGPEVLGGLTTEAHGRTFGVAIVRSSLHLLINIYVIVRRLMLSNHLTYEGLTLPEEI